MNRYSPVNRYIPKLEDLYEDAEMMLKGYGFSEDEIHREYPLGNTQKKIDMAGVKVGFSVGIELGRCSPERMFECVKYFDRVVWLPYWFTVIEDKPIKVELDRLQHENTEMKGLMNDILAEVCVLLNFNTNRIDYKTVEDAINFLRETIDNIQKLHQFLEKKVRRLREWGL